VPSLSIPEQHRSGLAKIRTLPDESASRLLAALRETPTSSKLASFVSDLVPAVSGIAPADLERIVATLYSLYQVNAYTEAPLDKFVREVLQAMELSGHADLKVPASEQDSFLERMRGLLSVSSLATLAKAQSLERDREHLFHDARILSDLTAVQDRHKSDDPCCKRGLCVPGTGVLRLRSAAVS
jgi:hypothetical protein